MTTVLCYRRTSLPFHRRDVNDCERGTGAADSDRCRCDEDHVVIPSSPGSGGDRGAGCGSRQIGPALHTRLMTISSGSVSMLDTLSLCGRGVKRPGRGGGDEEKTGIIATKTTTTIMMLTTTTMTMISSSTPPPM